MKKDDKSIKETKTLSRYIPSKYLDDLINNKRLALVNPDSWEDKNDLLAIKFYKEKKNIKCLFVACFTQTGETYHHWRIYGRNDGIRIVFNKNVLLRTIQKRSGYFYGVIDYVKLIDFKRKVNNLSQLPFIKRWPYRHEEEFRIIWTGEKCEGNTKYLPLPEKAIEKIVIAPWIPDESMDNLKKKIVKVYGNNMNVQRSSILESKNWLKMVHEIGLDKK